MSSLPPHSTAAERDETRLDSSTKNPTYSPRAHLASTALRRALVVSYHVQPGSTVGSLRPTAFVRALCEAGWHVTVIMGDVPDARKFWSAEERVAVHTVRDTFKISDSLVRALRALASRVRGPGRNLGPSPNELVAHAAPGSSARESALERLERYFHASCWFIDRYKLWSTIAFLRAVALSRRGRFDLVVSSGPPMSPHIAASLLARCTGALHVVDLRDPWVSGAETPPEYRAQLFEDLTMRIYRNCVAHARALIGASPGIVRVSGAAAAGLDTPMHLVMNGFSGEPRVRDTQLGGLHLLYTGTLYLDRNPFHVLEAIDRLLVQGELASDKVRITFIGACASWNGINVRDWAAGRPVANVLEIKDFVAREELPRLTAMANVCINFAQRQPLQIPAKTFEYLGDGVEMLVLAEDDSDTTRLVREAGGGLCVDGANQEAVEAAILDLYRRYAVDLQAYSFEVERRRQYSRAVQNERFLDIVQALTQPARVSVP